MISLFKRHTKEEHADVLADYLPNDRYWQAKKIDGKKLRQFLLGLARSARVVEDKLETVWEELDPSTTTLFIDEWESAVGIPDDSFSGDGTIEERRLHVVIKLSAAVQTAEDFEELAALLGVALTVQSGAAESFLLPLDIPFPVLGSFSVARFTIVVNVELTTAVLPLDIPFVVGDARINMIQRLFNKLKPANTTIIYL